MRFCLFRFGARTSPVLAVLASDYESDLGRLRAMN
jgi:hypothetical protein